MAEAREGLWMTVKERDRLKVLHEVKKRYITQKQAAAELGLSVRWVRKLLVRLRSRGDSALRHGLRGRPSNRKTPEAVKRRVVELYREKRQAKLWHDYGPTLAGEELAEDYGIAISRESLRQWLIEAEEATEARHHFGRRHGGLPQELLHHRARDEPHHSENEQAHPEEGEPHGRESLQQEGAHAPGAWSPQASSEAKRSP